MRKILVVALALIGSQALAAPRAEQAWVKRAPMTAVALQRAIAEAALAEVSGPRPITLLETNYYTFLPGEPLQLRLTVNANGFTAPATLYLYWENRTTGERRYYNVGGGLLAAGQQSDLFGTVGAPVPILVPTLSDFVLFGTAADSAALGWGVNGALGGSRVVAAN